MLTKTIYFYCWIYLIAVNLIEIIKLLDIIVGKSNEVNPKYSIYC